MTSRDFCYWLQGHFELDKSQTGLSAEQTVTIQRHLGMVFQHEIDPSMGDPAHQDALNQLHKPQPDIGGITHTPAGPVLYRC